MHDLAELIDAAPGILRPLFQMRQRSRSTSSTITDLLASGRDRRPAARLLSRCVASALRRGTNRAGAPDSGIDKDRPQTDSRR
jgi:hypothetical protein